MDATGDGYMAVYIISLMIVCVKKFVAHDASLSTLNSCLDIQGA
jgi:hypothetical protein